jgi:dTMP kinase
MAAEAGARGPFLALEGIEGAGKTTQVALLAERLRRQGREAVVVREPGGTPLAEEARRLVLDTPAALEPVSPAAELFLVLAARADLVQRVIRPALERGAVVLADRFDLSTRAYQVAGRGLAAPLVEAANRLATGGLTPDLYVVLELPVETGRARQATEGKARDRLESEGDGFHRRVAEAFRNAAGSNILHLAADRPADAVHAELWAALARRFPHIFFPDAG